MTTKYLRSVTLDFGEDIMVFSYKEVGTHSLWSGFAMELFLCQSVSRDNHDHGTMAEQHLTSVYPHLGQKPQQGHH